MNLNKSLFIEKRFGDQHLDLDGKWQFTDTEKSVCDPSRLDYENNAELPSTVAWCLHNSGILPHPYVGTNSKKYFYIKDRVWYFRKTFKCSKCNNSKFAYLCFDGASYYSKIWLNGVVLGEHEGMFGGPVCDVTDILSYEEENELIVELKACNYQIEKQSTVARPFRHLQPKSTIAPWHQINDEHSQNGHFNTVGLWRGVRIEFLNKYHITNPYVYTKRLEGTTAEVKIEVPIFADLFDETEDFSAVYSFRDDCPRNVYAATELPKTHDDLLTVKTTVSDGENTVFFDEESFNYSEYFPRNNREQANDYIYYTKNARLENIKPWYPNGMGEQHLYDVKIELCVNGVCCDTHTFKTGFRTITVCEGDTKKISRRGEKFQFVVNGKKIFLKGMNFTQLDQLLNESPAEHEWVLTLAKAQGINLVRIWNGGGVPECDAFYELCDKFGLMVWQDAHIANGTTEEWDVDVLRSQLVYNICRTRNHPSLAVYCGGNEFNPYTRHNAACMYASWDEYNTYIPDKIFYRTTPDGGSAHIYNDMEPTWYRHLYKHVPFIGESGIHSFPSFKTMKNVICQSEANTPLNNIFSNEFRNQFPELLNHFSEFIPTRIPRMLARASHIDNIKGILLEDLICASHIAAYEYYTVMIECILENYPATTGIMPWVFKRPWPTSAIQIVDYAGHPEYQYYAVKRAYQPCHPFVSLQHLNFKPGESVRVPVKAFCDNEVNGDIRITTKIYNDSFTVIDERSFMMEHLSKYCSDVEDFEFTLPEGLCDTYFFIRVTLSIDGKINGESFYYPKVLSKLSDDDVYNRERSTVCGNMLFEKGPFLKQILENMPKAELSVTVNEKVTVQNGIELKLTVKNESENTAYPVIIDSVNDDVRCLCSDNFFVLDGGEEKDIGIILNSNIKCDDFTVSILAYNSNSVIV